MRARRTAPDASQQHRPMEMSEQYLHDVDGAAEYLFRQMALIATGRIRDPQRFASECLYGARGLVLDIKPA